MVGLKLFTALLATAVSVSARRNLEGWVADGDDFPNTRCESSQSLVCNDLPATFCCDDPRFLFSSIRINNPENSDIIEGNVPGDGDFRCANTVVTGTGGDCISDGIGGIVGLSWNRPGLRMRGRGVDTCAPTECGGVQAPDELRFHGAVFNLTSMAEKDKDALLDIAATGSFADVPANLLALAKR